jgi:threonine dehydrogenase-like Zn-dependent dehydrogenase
MGEVVEVGPDVKNLKSGDRVVVPFVIACGQCFFCQHGLWSLCDNSNPNAAAAEAMYGFSPAGFFGYTHLFGGYAGGQAEFARVPYADTGPTKIPSGLTDEQVLFLSDIFPTAYMAAENCQIQPGDTVAVWGCGPVGLLTIKCAYLLGAACVIAIDNVPERLRMAEEQCKAEVINFEQQPDVVETLKQKTGGRGPDSCVDAVGLEAHGMGIWGVYDKAMMTLKMTSDIPTVFRQAIQACRKGGTVSVPGVYGGFVDKFPVGTLFGKGLTIKAGQTHVQRYTEPLLERVQRGDIDPSFVITHRMSLDEAPQGYATFKNKQDHCVKVVLKP